jgi:uncharacterized protein (DUF433 family)
VGAPLQIWSEVLIIPQTGKIFSTGIAMTVTTSATASHSSENGPRALLSLREVTLLAGVLESRVRKDIETGLLSPIKMKNSDRLLFRWADIFLFAGIYKGSLPSQLRQKAFEKFESMIEPTSRREFYRLLDTEQLVRAKCDWSRPSRLFVSYDRMKLDHYLFVDFEMVVHDVAPRVDLYAEGLARIEEKYDVLGGEPVFKGTRLSVRHVGRMYYDGEPIENIIEDYPYLRENDVRFAELFFRAHPALGRPPISQEADHARNPPS